MSPERSRAITGWERLRFVLLEKRTTPIPTGDLIGPSNRAWLVIRLIRTGPNPTAKQIQKTSFHFIATEPVYVCRTLLTQIKVQVYNDK